MKVDKYRKVHIRSFLLPFLVLFIIFVSVTLFYISRHIRRSYEKIEQYSLGLANSYSRIISNANKSKDIITKMTEEKMLAVGQIIVLFEKKVEAYDLIALADKYAIQEINIYNGSGEIIASTTESLVGWKAYQDHPVYNFIQSDQVVSTEEIRKNVVTEESFKYVYLKDEESLVIQIGILEKELEYFLHSFQINEIIQDFVKNEYVENIYFTDMEYNIIAGKHAELDKYILNEEDISEHFSSNEARIGKDFMQEGVLHACVPVFSENERQGTLTVIWSTQIIVSEIEGILKENIPRFFILSIFLGLLLYYAHVKRKEAVEAAFYDNLTGLPNENYIKSYLPKKIADCKKDKSALLLLNIVSFQLINLTYGLEYGDLVIKEVAKIYEKNLLSNDMLFRLEADKFIMLINGYSSLEEIEKRAIKILDDFDNPLINTYRHKYFDLNIAIYELYDPKLTVEQVIHDASLGLAMLKKDLSKKHIIFEKDIRDAALRDERIERVLNAICNEQDKESFSLNFQPLLDLQTNRIVGFEALARMNIADLGNISPLEFIDIAERHNLIFPLGNIILEKALDFLDSLNNLGISNVFVAINISKKQLLRSDFLEYTRKIIDKFSLSNRRIVFEVTETVFASDYEIISKNILGLRKMGIHIALDDFGTGYSSLSELRNLDVDIVKIDRSFIGRIKDSTEEPLIVQDIIAILKRLNMKIVAEGVEADYQMEYLIGHECDIIQGFYISKPMPKDQALEFLKDFEK